MHTVESNSFTSVTIEEGLKKLKDEINPFYDGHLSKLGIKRKNAETIGEMMRRWDETISCSKIVKDQFDFLQNKYFEKIKSEDKQALINKHIETYSEYRISEKSKSFEQGYTNKGFRWFEEKKDFSLKDFILHNPETISPEVFDEAVKFVSFPTITESLIENAPKQERYFCYACEGYAYARYVAFLKEEQIKKTRKIKSEKSFSITEIAIAYYFLKIHIDKDNGRDILKKWSSYKSVEKLLQKRINSARELTEISENRTTDTKHLIALKGAKRLLAIVKDKKALNDIDRTISTFEANLKNRY